MGVALRRSLLVAAGAAALLVAAGCGGGSSESSEPTTTGEGASNSDVRVALVSDIGKFNDRSFNQSQKEGLDRAVQELGIKSQELQSNSPSDYVPNLTTAVRKKADLVISAGFLLAADTNTVAKKNPNIHFAITDYG